MNAVAAPSPPKRKASYHSVRPVDASWISTSKELRVAVHTVIAVFLCTLIALLSTATVALATAPKADARYEQLHTRVKGANCLKVARRADCTVVYLNLGSPVQRLELLLDLEAPVQPGGEQLRIFSERMHKSQKMQCAPLVPPRRYEQQCTDVAMIAVNTTEEQQIGRVQFVYQNDKVELATGNAAALAGLDGTFRVVRGNTYWLTTTDLCFAPYEPESAETDDALPFQTNGLGHVTVASDALVAYAPTRALPVGEAAAAECNATMGSSVRLFPLAATNEQLVWLSLSDRFLYEYGSQVLEKRRRVVELGTACAALRPELAHVLDMYASDCGLAQQPCQTEPAVPFRRLATSRMRIDLGHDGNGTLRTEHTDSLKHIASLVSHEESLNSALGRLFVLLLTAAVVFLRGSQNAASSRYMFLHTIDVIRCRNQFAPNRDPLSFSSRHEKQEVATDAVISVAALAARCIVLVVSYHALVADDNATAVNLEVVGIAGSLVHLMLRYSLDWNLEREAPLTKLGGPMSVVDCTCAVLLLFSDAPLLATDNTKFSSIGRMLISVLASISVFTRCIFSAATVSVMAVSATNGARRDLSTHKTILSVSVLLWILEATTTAGNVALLFVRPAALSMARSTPGLTAPIHYATFFGLVCTSLPTFTKVALRVVEAECRVEEKKA